MINRQCRLRNKASLTPSSYRLPLKGDLSDRGRVRDELKNALPKIKPPRGPMQVDAYRQVITPTYITRMQKQDQRIVNAVIDTIPSVSQEATWGWWNKS